jgi:hypothetical protein
MMAITEMYDINQYALKLRRSGKLLREIGEELGVSSSRAKSRVIFGTRQEKVFERGKNATTMGDLFMSYKPMAAIKNLGYPRKKYDLHMSFLKIYHNKHLWKQYILENAAVKEILATKPYVKKMYQKKNPRRG